MDDPQKTTFCKIRQAALKLHHIAGLFFLLFLVSILYYFSKDINFFNFHEKRVRVEKVADDDDDNSSSATCDYFSGRWIYDINASQPLYKEKHCSFMEGAFACETYGRKDLKYQKWRWQPHHCDLPRFDGKLLLETLKGKKLIFVGDSLCRNQWVSMLCLLESSLPPSTNKSINVSGSSQSFHINEHNTTIEFYWSPYLVESSSDNEWHNQWESAVVRIHGIENHARHWNDADILVFDTYVWWMRHSMTILWGSFGSPNSTYKKVVKNQRHYEMALSTWSDWLEININRTKTKLFFMSVSPYHLSGETERQCYKVSEPLEEGGNWRPRNYSMMSVVASTLEKLEKRGLKVNYLRITGLSEYRLDAHPSINRLNYTIITEEKKKNPTTYADCTHWCLPGVPDVWNQILYSYIIKS